MLSRRLLLIVNPISGTSDKTELVPKIEKRLNDKGFEVTTLFTQKKGDATVFAHQGIAQGYDVIAACGGDGTVNETARAMCGSGVPMAIIPSGSGNGLARHIGLAADELAAINVIDEANITDCDYGLVNDRKFFCVLGVGFDAAVAEKFDKQHQRGLATYIRNAFQEFTKYHPKEYTITIDGVTQLHRKAYLVACCNASQYGNNVFIAPKASITDGLFDVIIMRDAPHIQTLIAGLDMLTGMLPYNRQIEIIRAKTVDIKVQEQQPMHIDGEPMECTQDLHIEIVPGKLKLFTNNSDKKFTPIITPLDYMTRDITAAINKLFE